MAKVIDALVVTLGLDPSGYKKGAAEAKVAQEGLKQSAQQEAKTAQGAAEAGGKSAQKLGAERRKQDTEERKRQRERERAARNQQDQDKKHTDAAIGRLKSLGLAAAGLVVGFNSVKGAFEAYLSTTNQLANLGRVAPTVGVDVKALDMLGDAYKQVGGKAEEASSDIAKLAHAQFSFAINAPDALAGWARRLGVGLFDEKTGQARDKLAIEEDIARALKSKTKDIQAQAMYAREMGLSESFIQLYLVKQASERAKILADAEKTAKADEASTKSAAAVEQSWARVANSVKGVKEKLVSVINPTLAIAGNHLANDIQSGSLKAGGKDLAKAYVGGAYAFWYRSTFRAADKKYGLPEGTLENVARKESNFNPNAVSSKGAVGMMQLMPKYFPNAGKDVTADIDSAGKELSRLYKLYQSQGLGPQAAYTKALQAYNFGQGNLAKADRTGAALPKETQNYPAGIVDRVGQFNSAIAPTSDRTGSIDRSSTSSSNTTHIEQINIHTQATDATGIAVELPDAIRRQNVVAQANTGQR